MGRKAKENFTLGVKTKELIQTVSDTLAQRGAASINMGELLETLVLASTSDMIENFVFEHTPLEYKLKKLLENEGAAKEIGRLAKKHKLGLQAGV